MTYAINGVDLDNAALGWVHVRGSIPVLPIEINNPTQSKVGMDGVTPYFAARLASAFRFIVKSPLTTRGDLTALFTSPTLVVTDSEKPGWEATGRLLSSSVEEYHEARNWATDLFVVEIPFGAWRDAQITTSLVAATATGATHTFFEGISAPVQDAWIQIRGPIQNPQITDPSGSYVSLSGTLDSGQYMLFSSKTGRAWLGTTPIWAPNSNEISGLVNFGGPRGVFEITPQFTTNNNPTARNAKLTLTQSTYGAGSGFQVRGQNAYIL